jgi:hypothetical protein
MAYVTKLNFTGINSREPTTLGFEMFQFSPFIKLTLFHINTVATYSFSK